MTQTFKIFRFNPDEDKEPYYKSYQVEIVEGMTILDVLNQIKWTQDGGLTFRRSCRHGICGSCAMDPSGLRVCREGPVFRGDKLAGTEFGRYGRDASGRRVDQPGSPGERRPTKKRA